MNSGDDIRFVSVTAVLPALDILQSISFYERLGFASTFVVGSPPDYAGMKRDSAEIHLFKTDNSQVARWTSCRVVVERIDLLFEEYRQRQALRPSPVLEETPHGTREIRLIDPDGVEITFFERPKPPTS